MVRLFCAEAFYGIAVTPAASLTLDFQIIDAAFSRTDTTVILGMRLNIRF